MDFAATHHTRPSPWASPALRIERKRGTITLIPLTLSEVFVKFMTAVDNSSSTEAAILHLMNQYDFDLTHLHRALEKEDLDVCFSRILFNTIAPLVGLDPPAQLRDAKRFEIRRARITNNLFSKIVDDVHVATNIYGLPREKGDGESRSRLVFSMVARIIAEFRLLIKFTPESITETLFTSESINQGCLNNHGRIEYLFRSFGGIFLLFIEVPYNLRDKADYLDTAAQVIAEVNACDYINGRNDLQCPVYGILCDGSAFELFRFDSSQVPQIAIGTFTLSIADLRTTSTVEYFSSVRELCETVFHILLLGYEQRLESLHAKAKAAGGPVCHEWVMAMCYASLARMEALSATRLHMVGDLDGAEGHAQVAATNLKDSLERVPERYMRTDVNLKDGWNMKTLIREM